MKQYFIGVDASTSNTGLAIIDENENLVYYKSILTKDSWETAESYYDGFSKIYNAIEDLIRNDNDLYFLFREMDHHFVVGFEYNIFKNAKVAVLLNTINGIIFSIFKRQIANLDKGHFNNVSNWRAKIIQREDLDDTNDNQRDFLKFLISNWAEKKFNIKLPLFTDKKYGAIEIPCTEKNYNILKDKEFVKVYVDTKNNKHLFDMRINDVSDAIAIAFAVKNGYMVDSKELRVSIKKQDKEIRSIKNYVDNYKAMVEDWEKRAKQELKEKERVSSVTLKTLFQHCETLRNYLDRLKEKDELLERMKKYYILIENIYNKYRKD